MSDPERLLDRAGSLDARLLAAALDEPPPPDLLARTLATVGAAAPSAPSAPASAVAAKAAGGGLLGPIGIGVLAGVITVGAFELAASSRPPSSARPPAPAQSPREPAAPPAVADRPATPPPSPVAPPSIPPSPTVIPRPATLAAEIALLDAARSALRGGDPTRARALLDQYAREIPRGQMAREAALLRADVAQAAQATNR